MMMSNQVTRLTISMLLQRLRAAEPTMEAAIAYNLVDLALFAPETAFADIIRVFSSINRSANPDDPRFSNNMVTCVITELLTSLKHLTGVGCPNKISPRAPSATRAL
jgi:phosphatidylinositol 4-kinase